MMKGQWRVSNSRIPAYEAGAQPSEHHRRGTPDTIRTCNTLGLGQLPLPLGYGGEMVGASGADPDADGS